MRIALVDPLAYAPPYDHALASAVAAEGHSVTLLTSRFPHGEVPEPSRRAAQPPYDLAKDTSTDNQKYLM